MLTRATFISIYSNIVKYYYILFYFNIFKNVMQSWFF